VASEGSAFVGWAAYQGIIERSRPCAERGAPERHSVAADRAPPRPTEVWYHSGVVALAPQRCRSAAAAQLKARFVRRSQQVHATKPLGELLESAYRSFLNGSPRELLALFHDEVAYHLPGFHLGGGTLRGRNALLERLAAAAQACTSPPRIDLLSVLSRDAWVVTFERFRAESPTTSVDQRVCVVWRFVGERCVEIWAHFEDQPACDAFWQGVAL